MHDVTPAQKVLEFAESIYSRADGLDNVVPAAHQPNWLDRPHRFRAYLDEPRILLPGTSHLQRDYSESRRQRMSRPASAPSLGELALISYLMLAPMRRKLDINWNAEPPIDFGTQEFGRGSASGGGLYPTQLYWVTSQQLDTPPAVYHYSPSEHALTPIRHGDWTAAIQDAVDVRSDGTRFDSYFVLAADFWSNCFKYHNFGLHVCGQDVGATLSTLQIACDALSVGQRSYSLFDDGAVNRVIGIDGHHESAFAVAGIGPFFNPTSRRAVARPDVPHFSPSKPIQRSKEVWIPREFLEIHRLTCVSQEQVATAIDVAGTSAQSAWVSPALGLPLEQSVQDCLPAILRQRRSAWGSLRGPHSLAGDALLQILRFVWRRCGDGHLPLREALPAGGIGISAHVSDVAGIERGVYAWNSMSSALVRSVNECELHLQETYSMGNYNVEEAACVLFVTGDLPAVVERYGPRGYRILNTHVGLIAQATYVAASALGLDCGAVLGVRAQYVKRALQLPESQNVSLAIYLSQSQRPAHLFDYSLTPDVPKWEPIQ
jgi:SagB-type dehydrogenase family enzyme